MRSQSELGLKQLAASTLAHLASGSAHATAMLIEAGVPRVCVGLARSAARR